MKKLGLTMFFAICLFFFGKAQDYNTGIGFRGGFSNGLTIKHFVSQKAAFEGILSSRWSGFQITGLYEIHNRAFNADRLNWYFGFGAHIGFWNGNKVPWSDDDEKYTVVGIDGILGLEYNFREIPINLSIDWKPELNFYGHNGFWGDGGALSVRYIF
ncbi:MAG: hypothetical protein PF694_07815 [Bacteroidetes bacterium]|jgi:hypothetical protein|nr:hypothetical protein [Bacteroidota bacterium]